MSALPKKQLQRFPEARIAILSSDLARGVFLRDVIRDVAKGEYNLVIGTQLVAKGHHFPFLTFVGVVDADLALESSDPRGGERTWALMAQVAGRAGRGEKPGHALVQTHVPEHPLMQALKKGDREGYLAQEKLIRENAGLAALWQARRRDHRRKRCGGNRALRAACRKSCTDGRRGDHTGTGNGPHSHRARTLPLALSGEGPARGEYPGFPAPMVEGHKAKGLNPSRDRCRSL